MRIRTWKKTQQWSATLKPGFHQRHKHKQNKFSSEVYEDKAERIFFCSAIAYARSLILVFMLMLMLMSHASANLFVLSFVLPCAYAYVASENQALENNFIVILSPFGCFTLPLG